MSFPLPTRGRQRNHIYRSPYPITGPVPNFVPAQCGTPTSMSLRRWMERGSPQPTTCKKCLKIEKEKASAERN